MGGVGRHSAPQGGGCRVLLAALLHPVPLAPLPTVPSSAVMCLILPGQEGAAGMQEGPPCPLSFMVVSLVDRRSSKSLLPPTP